MPDEGDDDATPATEKVAFSARRVVRVHGNTWGKKFRPECVGDLWNILVGGKGEEQ